MKARVLKGAIRSFNRDLAKYAETSSKGRAGAIEHQAGKFRFRVAAGLKRLAPVKGEARDDALLRLGRGGGVRVRAKVRREILVKRGARTSLQSRKTVFGRSKAGSSSALRRGKRLNLQAMMVQRELAVRESGRGFLAHSARTAGLLLSAKHTGRRTTGEQKARGGSRIGLVRVDTIGRSPRVEFRFFAGGMRPVERRRGPVARALREVQSDMRVYLEQREARAARQSLKPRYPATV